MKLSMSTGTPLPTAIAPIIPPLKAPCQVIPIGYGLTRSSSNIDIAEDPQGHVTYNREAGRVVAINLVPGTESYNYPYRDPQRNTSEGAL